MGPIVFPVHIGWSVLAEVLSRGAVPSSETSLQPLNRWRVAQFRELWRRSGCEVESCLEPRDERFIGIVERYPAAFQGRGLTIDDLAVHGTQVVLRRPSR
jgi:hypothetical protein